MPFLPAGLLLWDRFDPEDWLKSYHGPVKIVLAGLDEIIPTKFGRRLFDSYNGPKACKSFPVPITTTRLNNPPHWWAEVFSFWQTNSQTVEPPPK